MVAHVPAPSRRPRCDRLRALLLRGLGADLGGEAAARELAEVAGEVALGGGFVAELEQAGAAAEQRALGPRWRQWLIDEHLKVAERRATIVVGAQLRADQSELVFAPDIFDRQRR